MDNSTCEGLTAAGTARCGIIVTVGSGEPAANDRGDHGDAAVVGRPRMIRRVPGLLRHTDLALGYGLVVLVVAIVLAVAPAHTRDAVVANTSTNLSNLRRRPLWVLLASAFVLSSLSGLWQLLVLLWLYATAQRWVGRLATIFVAALGHVGATLFVATMLAAGIAHGRLARSVAHASDVGISYGLACIAGFVVSRIPARWRAPYVVVLVAYLVGPLLVSPTFTGVGHTTALTLGFALAFLAWRVSAAASRSLPPGPDQAGEHHG